jgi:ankyrin repeat protein
MKRICVTFLITMVSHLMGVCSYADGPSDPPYSFREAVVRGDIAAVKRAIAHGADVNKVDGNGTALMLAVREDKSEVVKTLLESGADPELRDGYYAGINTALIEASERARTNILAILIAGGARVDGTNSVSQTALMRGAYKGQIASMEILLNKGANLEAKDYEGRTALFGATEAGQEAAVRLLLSKGAKVNAQDKKGRTPLMLASRGYDLAVIRMLLDKGALINVQDNDGQTALLWASYGPFIAQTILGKPERSSQGYQDRLKPALTKQAAAVSFLLSQGADPNIRANDGRTVVLPATSR